MLTVQAMGFVTADPVLKEGNAGSYVTFLLAVHKGYGEKKHTVYLDCSASGSVATRMVNGKVKKGSSLAINGEADLADFTRRDGSTGKSLRVAVSQWEYTPFRKTADAETYPEPQEPPDQPPPEIHGDDEELP